MKMKTTHLIMFSDPCIGILGSILLDAAVQMLQGTFQYGKSRCEKIYRLLHGL